MAGFYEHALDAIPEARHDPQLRYRAALTHHHRARSLDAHDAATNRPETLQHYSRAITLLDELARTHPEEPWYRYNLFRSLSLRADVEAEVPDLVRAEADATESLRVVQALARDFPAEPNWRDAVAYQHVMLAHLRTRQGRGEEVEREAGLGLKIASELVEDDPDRPAYLRNVHRALELLAHRALQAGRLAEAEALYRRALEANQQLIAHFPAEHYQPYYRSENQRRLGLVLIRQGQLSEAETILQDARGAAQRLATTYPFHDDYLVQPLRIDAALARCVYEAGRTAEAETLYQETIRGLEVLLGKRPSLAVPRALLADLYADCPIAGLRDPAQARASARRSHAVRQRTRRQRVARNGNPEVNPRDQVGGPNGERSGTRLRESALRLVTEAGFAGSEVASLHAQGGSMQRGLSFLGLLTSLLTGWASIQSSGNGTSNGLRASGRCSSGSSHRA